MADLRELRDRVLNRVLTPLEPAFEAAERLWHGFSRRDRILVVGLALLFTSLALVFGGGAARRSIRDLEAQVAARQKDLKTAEEMKGVLAASRERVKKMEQELQQQGDFSLAGYLEQSGGVTIAAVQERGTTDGEFFKEQKVDVTVRGATLPQLVELLFKLKTAPRHLRVTDLKVKTQFRNREQLDLNIEVTLYGPLDAAPAAEPGDKQG